MYAYEEESSSKVLNTKDENDMDHYEGEGGEVTDIVGQADKEFYGNKRKGQ